MHHEYIKMKIPARFLNELWLNYGKGEVHLMVMHSVTDNKVSVDTITAVTSKHKAINWSAELYAHIDQQAAKHYELLSEIDRYNFDHNQSRIS